MLIYLCALVFDSLQNLWLVWFSKNHSKKKINAFICVPQSLFHCKWTAYNCTHLSLAQLQLFGAKRAWCSLSTWGCQVGTWHFQACHKLCSTDILSWSRVMSERCRTRAWCVFLRICPRVMSISTLPCPCNIGHKWDITYITQFHVFQSLTKMEIWNCKGKFQI